MQLVKNGDIGDQFATTQSREGRWGYMIVASVFLIRFLFAGLYQTQTFYFVEWQREFGTSSAEASLLVSMGSVVIGISSPISGTLATIFGTRTVAMSGGLLVTLGCIGTMLVESTLGILLTWGVMIGFGFALAYSPAIAMIGQYFHTHFTVANGVALSGGSVGQIIVPLLTNVLIQRYGWRGTVLVLSAAMFHLMISGAVLRPRRAANTLDGSKDKKVVSAQENMGFDNTETEHELLSTTSSPRAFVAVHEAKADTNKTNLASNVDTTSFMVNIERNETNKSCLSENVGIRRSLFTVVLVLKSIFTNISFDIMLLVFFSFGYIFYATIAHAIPQALKAGISESSAAILPTVFGIGNLMGQVVPALIADFFHIPRGAIAACAFAMCSILSLLNHYFTTFSHYIIFHMLYGIASGTGNVFIYTIIQIFLREEHRVIGVGFAVLLISAGYITGAFCTGWIVDITGSYNVANWFSSGIAAIGAILLVSVTYIDNIHILLLKVKEWISSCCCHLYGVCYILH